MIVDNGGVGWLLQKEHHMTIRHCHRRMINNRAVITVELEFSLRPRSRKTDEHLLCPDLLL